MITAQGLLLALTGCTPLQPQYSRRLRATRYRTRRKGQSVGRFFVSYGRPIADRDEGGNRVYTWRGGDKTSHRRRQEGRKERAASSISAAWPISSPTRAGSFARSTSLATNPASTASPTVPNSWRRRKGELSFENYRGRNIAGGSKAVACFCFGGAPRLFVALSQLRFDFGNLQWLGRLDLLNQGDKRYQKPLPYQFAYAPPYDMATVRAKSASD